MAKTKKRVVKKTKSAKAKAVPKKKPKGKTEKPFDRAQGKPVGVVTHFFPKVGVAVVKVKSSIVVGDCLAFRGATTDFTQTVASFQIDHRPIQKAAKGKEIGMKVQKRVREGDDVFRAS